LTRVLSRASCISSQKFPLFSRTRTRTKSKVVGNRAISAHLQAAAEGIGHTGYRIRQGTERERPLVYFCGKYYWGLVLAKTRNAIIAQRRARNTLLPGGVRMGIEFREFINWARRRKTLASILCVATLTLGIMIGILVPGGALARRADAPNGAEMLAVPDPVALSNAFSGITKKVEPAVVNISTTQVLQKPKSSARQRGGSSSSEDDLLDRFFNAPDDTPDAERSIGSGVIVDKKGFILTNEHVIDEATSIKVSMDGDPTHYNARVIGSDKDTDLAVIKIEADHELPVASLGNSDGVQVGDWVLAFGSPFGFSSTVTAGIVSAKNRSAEGQGQFQRFIQTDAAINPGNSGGPLVNMAGEVIGINTAIYTGSRGFEGVGLSMPSNVAINVYNQLVTSGKVTRGAIGITFDDLVSQNPALMKQLGAPYGIVVEATDTDSPAAKAGLQALDVITSVNGQPVHNGADLVNPIAATPIGQSVQLHLFRDKEPKDVTLVVEDRSKVVPSAFDGSGQRSGQNNDAGQLGLHVQDLTSDLSQKLGMGKIAAGSSGGVVVSDIDPASFAEDLLFQTGDVILEINHVAVPNLQSYHREMAKLQPGQDVLFKIKRYDGRGDHVLIVPLAGTIPTAETK
jgi:serine protease Do